MVSKLSFVSLAIAMVNLQCGLGCLLPPPGPPTGNGGTPTPPPAPRPTAPSTPTSTRAPVLAPAPVPNPGYNPGQGTYPGAGGRHFGRRSVENNFGNICGFLQRRLLKFPKIIYSRELTPDFFATYLHHPINHQHPFCLSRQFLPIEYARICRL